MERGFRRFRRASVHLLPKQPEAERGKPFVHCACEHGDFAAEELLKQCDILVDGVELDAEFFLLRHQVSYPLVNICALLERCTEPFEGSYLCFKSFDLFVYCFGVGGGAC